MKEYLGNPKNTIEIIQKYEFMFQKKFGQNFLIDTHVLEKIICFMARRTSVRIASLL